MGSFRGSYYRLEKIVDRNGNELRYTYWHEAGRGGTEKSLNTVPAHISTYHQSPEGQSDVESRRLTFTYTNLGGSGGPLRLKSVVAPLNRAHEYLYTGEGLLSEVVKSAVTDPGLPEGSAPVTPSVKFTYRTTPQLPRAIVNFSGINWGAPGDELIRWTLPETITDARGHETTFAYEFELTPTAIRSNGGLPVGLYEEKPYLTTVTTVDGAATFETVGQRTHASATTRVTDTRGVETTYDFDGQIIEAPTDQGYALVIDRFTRAVDVTGPDGAKQAKTVTYRYTGDVNGNLTEVEDMSGNVVRFGYDSGDADDPYNAKPYGNKYGTQYAIRGQPASSTLAAGELNLTTDYRYDTTFNKLVEQTDAEGVVTRYTLDGNGNRTVMTEAFGSPVQGTTVYDYFTGLDADGAADGRLYTPGFVTRTTDPDGRVTEFVPNQHGNVEYTVVKGHTDEDLTPLDATSAFTNISTRTPSGSSPAASRT